MYQENKEYMAPSVTVLAPQLITDTVSSSVDYGTTDNDNLIPEN